jgi:hypothetical protein
MEGDVCFNMQSYVDRSVVFNFHCDSSTKGSFSNAYETDTLCKYSFDFNTKLACIQPAQTSSSEASQPVQPASTSSGLSSGSKFLLLLGVGLALYCGLGIAYNKYTSESSTITESLPHKEFWSEIPSLASDGVSFTLMKLKSGAESVKGKMSSQSHEPI